MANVVYLFEDEGWRNLLPLTYLRSVSELRCGGFTLKERIEKILGVKDVRVLARDCVSSTHKIPQTPKNLPIANLVDDAIYINGRLLKFSGDELLNLEKGEMLLVNDEVVAFRPVSKPETHIPFTNEFLGTQKELYSVRDVEFKLVRYPWDLIETNQAMLAHDLSLLGSQMNGFVDSGVTLYGDKEGLSLGENSRIENFSILYLEEGPIYIGKDVKISGFTSIEGPCYIGDGSVVEGAKLRTSSFGPGCRLSGEIEASIFQGYANKRHEGFLGHSVIGEWVNLGAGTTNSDLKNNYKEVRVSLRGEPKSTGIMKVGCFVGDHTKTGIGTLINTGAVFGAFCNLLGGKLSPKYLPPFSWDTGDGFTEYQIDKAIETARTVMGRRGLELTTQIEEAVKELFEMTKPERSSCFG